MAVPKIEDMSQIICEVQYVHFQWDQIEEKGAVGLEEAIKAFRSFPFEDQLDQAESMDGPTMPTVTFRDILSSAALSVWKVAPRGFHVCIESAERSTTAVIVRDRDVETLIAAFFAQDAPDLHALALSFEIPAGLQPARRLGESKSRQSGTSPRLAIPRTSWGSAGLVTAAVVILSLNTFGFVLASLERVQASFREPMRPYSVQPELVGLFFAVAGLIFVRQFYTGWKNGYMHFGNAGRIHRADQPRMFKMWIAVHVSWILVVFRAAWFAFSLSR